MHILIGWGLSATTAQVTNAQEEAEQIVGRTHYMVDAGGYSENDFRGALTYVLINPSSGQVFHVGITDHNQRNAREIEHRANPRFFNQGAFSVVVVNTGLTREAARVQESRMLWAFYNEALFGVIQSVLFDGFSHVELERAGILSNAVTDAITVELEETAREFGELFRCQDAATAMAAVLIRAGRRPVFAELQYGLPNPEYPIINVTTISGGRIGSAFPPGATVSRSGHHVGILFNGRIHCNVHPAGLPEEVWFNDFSGLGQQIRSFSPYIMGVSLFITHPDRLR